MSPLGRERAIALGLSLLWAAPLAAQEIHFEGGASLGIGDYVYTQRTSGAAFSAGFAWSTRRLTLRASLPYFVRDTRLLTPRGDPSPPEDDALPSPPGSHEGSVGDPFLQLFAGIVATPRAAVGMGLSIKVPVVEAGDFGTGGWDVGGSLSLSQAVGSSTLVGFDGSFWHLSDPEGLQLQDTVMGTATVARGLGPRWSLSASLSASRSAVAGYADPWWCSVLLGRLFSRGIWGVTITIGLSETAPDFGLGLIWRLRLG
jgi:hypothetical protein